MLYMNIILKITFFLAAGFNSLIALFYLVMTVFGLIFPPAPHYRSFSGVLFALGCAAVICMLGWAYWLTFVQGKQGTGFSILVVSYITWIPVLILMVLFGKGSWQ